VQRVPFTGAGGEALVASTVISRGCVPHSGHASKSRMRCFNRSYLQAKANGYSCKVNPYHLIGFPPPKV
jgi:hypothetical protein